PAELAVIAERADAETLVFEQGYGRETRQHAGAEQVERKLWPRDVGHDEIVGMHARRQAHAHGQNRVEPLGHLGEHTNAMRLLGTFEAGGEVDDLRVTSRRIDLLDG